MLEPESRKGVNMETYPKEGQELRVGLLVFAMLGCLFFLLFFQFRVVGWLDEKDAEIRSLRYYASLRERYVERLESEFGEKQELETSRLDRRIGKLQPRLDPVTRRRILQSVYDHCGDLSPSLVVHLICRETVPPFNPLSKSGKDAIGLMQVRYEVHRKSIPELAELRPTELYHIDNNIKFGCMILRSYIASSRTLDEALKKYVGGNLKKYVDDICRLMAEYEVGKGGL